MVPIRIRSFRRGNSIVKAFSRSRRKGKLPPKHNSRKFNKVESLSPRFKPTKKVINKTRVRNTKFQLEQIINSKSIMNTPAGRSSLGLPPRGGQTNAVSALKYERSKAQKSLDKYVMGGDFNPDIFALKKQKLRLAKRSHSTAYKTASDIQKQWTKEDLMDN
jgi:hypothetical protein